MGRKTKTELEKSQDYASTISLSAELFNPLNDISECFGVPVSSLVRTAVAIATPVLVETYSRLSKYSLQIQGYAAAQPILLDPDTKAEISKSLHIIQDRIARRNATTNKAITQIRDKRETETEVIDAKGLADEHIKEQELIEASLPKESKMFDEEGNLNPETEVVTPPTIKTPPTKETSTKEDLDLSFIFDFEDK